MLPDLTFQSNSVYWLKLSKITHLTQKKQPEGCGSLVSIKLMSRPDASSYSRNISYMHVCVCVFCWITTLWQDMYKCVKINLVSVDYSICWPLKAVPNDSPHFFLSIWKRTMLFLGKQIIAPNVKCKTRQFFLAGKLDSWYYQG